MRKLAYVVLLGGLTATCSPGAIAQMPAPPPDRASDAPLVLTPGPAKQPALEDSSTTTPGTRQTAQAPRAIDPATFDPWQAKDHELDHIAGPLSACMLLDPGQQAPCIDKALRNPQPESTP